jgi:branched-chain amino acid aminotransferase
MANNFEWREGALAPLGISADLTSGSSTLPVGAYTTLRTYGARRVLHLEDHARRLADSAGAPLSAPVLRAALRAALDATGFAESRVRVTFAPPRLFVSVEPFVPPPDALYRDGARCATVPLHRDRPHAKDTRFIATAASVYGTLPPGVHEGLLVDVDGAVLEGLSSNFFAVVDGALRTEDARALPGITRSLVLEVARGLLPVILAAPRLEELGHASECFITSASRGVMPVVEIDGTPLGSGLVGAVTAELRRRFEDRIAAEAEEV